VLTNCFFLLNTAIDSLQPNSDAVNVVSFLLIISNLLHSNNFRHARRMCTYQRSFLCLKETRRSLRFFVSWGNDWKDCLRASIGYFTSAECAVIAGVIWQEEKVEAAEYSFQICDSCSLLNQKQIIA